MQLNLKSFMLKEIIKTERPLPPDYALLIFPLFVWTNILI